MLHYKDITNLSELKSTFVAKHKKEDFFANFMRILKIGKIHAVFSNVKQKGIPVLMLMRVLIVLPFIDQNNVYSFTKSIWFKFAKFGKDSFYRLKNNPKMNWRSFHFGVLKRVLQTISDQEQEDNDNPKAFIFDDTTIPKRGKKIEGVSIIWDHVFRKYVLGFHLLVMGYYDGTMFLPINFSFHRSKGRNKKKLFGLKAKDYRKQYRKNRDKKTQGSRRKAELDKSKIAASIEMLKMAVRQKIKAEYVLTDSWFTCLEMVKTAMNNNLIYIGMYSKVKTLFEYGDKKLTIKQLRKINRAKIKRNRKFNLYYIRLVVGWGDFKVVLYFTRKGKRGNWKVVLSTDLSSTFQDTIEVYQIRWTIEVFFKESKQLLRLGKSQSKDFDGQIGDTTIVMIQYIILALHNRVERYIGIGKMFENIKEHCTEKRIHQRLISLLFVILEIIESMFEQADSELIMSKVINDEEVRNKLLRLIKPPEKIIDNAA